MASIYLIGSLRNPEIPVIAKALRDAGHEVFDDWYAAGPEADDYWQRYEQNRGRSYIQALDGLAVDHVFQFDRTHLDRCDVGVMVGPAGKSAHLELGYVVGRGKPGYVLLDKEPDRWDAMLRFATRVCLDIKELMGELAPKPHDPWRAARKFFNSDYPAESVRQYRRFAEGYHW